MKTLLPPLLTRLRSAGLARHNPFAEPLDHPALAGATRAFIDDLPMPTFAVTWDGLVLIKAEA